MRKIIGFNKHKGMNRLYSVSSMPPEYVYDLYNCLLNKDNEYEVRAGCGKLNTTVIAGTPAIKNLFEVTWNDLTTSMIARAGTAWWKYNTGTRAFDSLDASRPSNSKGCVVMFGNEAILVDGALPRKCTSAFVMSNLGGSPPSTPSVAFVHEHKVWMNDDDNPMKAYYCKSDNAEDWTAAADAGNLDLSKVLPSGDKIIGYATVGKTLLAIYLVHHIVIYLAGTDPADFAIQQVIVRTGCASQMSSDQVGNDVFFASQTGIKSLLASITSQDLDIMDKSKDIDPYYRDLYDNVTDKQQIHGVYYHKANQYWLLMPQNGSHDIVVYSKDLELIAGRIKFQHQNNIYCLLETADGKMYGGSDGYVYELDTDATTDDGTAIPWTITSGLLYAKAPGNFKKGKFFGIHVKYTAAASMSLDYWYSLKNLTQDAKTLTLTMSVESAMWDVAFWDKSYWDANENKAFIRKPIIGRGNAIQLSINGTSAVGKPKIPYYYLEVDIQGVKK